MHKISVAEYDKKQFSVNMISKTSLSTSKIAFTDSPEQFRRYLDHLYVYKLIYGFAFTLFAYFPLKSFQFDCLDSSTCNPSLSWTPSP